MQTRFHELADGSRVTGAQLAPRILEPQVKWRRDAGRLQRLLGWLRNEMGEIRVG